MYELRSMNVPVRNGNDIFLFLRMGAFEELATTPSQADQNNSKWQPMILLNEIMPLQLR